jgi:hypothetical protein
VARDRKRSNTISVDFAGVESRVKVEEGEHSVEVSEVSKERGDKGDYISWKFKVFEGDCEGGVLYYNTSLTKQSLWNLKQLLEALGEDVPDDEMDIDLAEMIGKQMTAVTDTETFEGKPKSRIIDFSALEKRSSKKERKKDRDDKDEDKDKKDRKGRDKDDDKDKKDRGSKRDKKKSKKIAQDEVLDMSQDELQDLVKEHELDVDLDDFKSLTKMRNAVIDKLEGEDLLES